MRQTCHQEGFQSFALVPCRPDHETVALLHVCDTQKGLLSNKLVASLEHSGRHFAKLVFQLRELERVESQPREAEQKQLQILVVDDEVEAVSLTRDMLEAKGHRVTIAFSGLEAIETLKDTKFDLVITDFNMPLMSGLGLAEEIWTRWHPFAPPVILMSGTSSEEIPLCEKGSPDVAAFLSKPFSMENLMETVHAVVQ
jgi:CheY-like chemotaxis protein